MYGYQEMYEKFGSLQYDLLVRDKLLVVRRDDDNKIVPHSRHQYQHKVDYKEISLGQHHTVDGVTQLHGIGRKIKIWTKYGGGIVYEGQFKNGKLDGFARWTQCFYDDKFDQYIGWWKDGFRHGYGRKIDFDNEVHNGWFENADQHFGDPVKDKSEIKSYNITTDEIAKEVDFEKYGQELNPDESEEDPFAGIPSCTC